MIIQKLNNNFFKWLIVFQPFIFILMLFILMPYAYSLSYQKENMYMSLKYEETNVRSGPNKKFPIKYKYKIKGMPVIVLGRYDNWYKIKDKDNNIGWVNNHLLYKSKNVITLNEKNFVYKSKKIEKSYPIMKIDKNIVLKLIKCNKTLCKISIKEKNGWIKQTDIWGFQELK